MLLRNNALHIYIYIYFSSRTNAIILFFSFCFVFCAVLLLVFCVLFSSPFLLLLMCCIEEIACLQINISKSVQLYNLKRIRETMQEKENIMQKEKGNCWVWKKTKYKKQLNNLVHMLSVFTWIHFLCFRSSSRCFLSNYALISFFSLFCFLFFFFFFKHEKCNWNGNIIQIHSYIRSIICVIVHVFLCYKIRVGRIQYMI